MPGVAASWSAAGRAAAAARSAWTPGDGSTINQWLEIRLTMPVGALLCVVGGPTAGRPWSATAARATLRHLAVSAGVRRRFAPHQLRHAHAVEMAREGAPLVVHANLGITSIYLEGIDSSEIINTVHHRPAPVLPASAGLR